MNDAIPGKTFENAKKYRDIKLVITQPLGNYLASEPNHHATNFFFIKFIINGKQFKHSNS